MACRPPLTYTLVPSFSVIPVTRCPGLVRDLVRDPAASHAVEAVAESDILPTVCMG
jgi:hypothetical protein